MSNEQCPPHHWVIDQFNVGRCKKCPAVRNFGALLSKEVAKVSKLAQEHGAKRGRKKKQATSGRIASVTTMPL